MMKQTHRVAALVAVLILGILLLAGCGPALTLNGAPTQALPAVAATNNVVEETSPVVAVSGVGDTAVGDTVYSDTPAQVTSQTSPTLDLNAFQDTLTNLYEQINPGVVNIQVTLDSGASLPEGLDLNSLPENHPFLTPQFGQGSGFVYSDEGYIITNNHVVEGANKITVVFADGTEADATLIGTDPGSDLAVIQVDVPASKLNPVPVGSSDDLKVGQFVIAIGNPFGLDGSMTSGIISGLGRTLPADTTTVTGSRFSIPAIIQTDAAINPGNSGGPLLNLAGEVIGVNTAIATESGTFSGVGYAVPAATVRQVVPQIIETGEIAHPWIGISGREMNGTLAEAMNMDADQRGVLVVEVVAGGPSDKAGLRASSDLVTIDGFEAAIGGDIIVGINGQQVVKFDDLLSYIVQKTAVGDTINLTVLRGGEQVEVSLTLEARPTQ
ncbi:MAG: trypsin-like peptidase domain-containing protein [Chloroflexi bacterium]|nr:trypsin-like peptidase domain-containing protein [Chloroflexota bacterium]